MLVSVKIDEREMDVIVNPVKNGELTVSFQGKTYIVDHEVLSNGGLNFIIDGKSHTSFLCKDVLHLDGQQYFVEVEDPLRKELLNSSGFKKQEGAISASMPGNVVKILVVEGEEVEEGQGVIVLEAMKMENELEAPKSGVIKKIYVNEREAVESGTILVEIE